ncbi:MAG: GntR family transcriptional regulator, partial [Myxococcota bacterium]
LERILSGEYGPGARLPAEREWVKETGASRVSIRAALGRLSDWGVIEVRRGSGAVVRSRRHWTFEVLPDYMRHASRQGALAELGPNVLDMLEARRHLVVTFVGKVAGRVKVGGLDPARKALQDAWEARSEPHRFTELDVEMIRELLSCAGMMSSLWLLNGVASVYLRVSREFPSEVIVAEDYVPVHLSVFDHLERGASQAATRTLMDYLERHDTMMLVRTLAPKI